MKYITSTELRTKSKELIEALREGNSVVLIHRSKEVGTIAPPKAEKPAKLFNAKKFMEAAKELDLPQTTNEEREASYRQHIEKKYGKHLD